MKLFDSTKVILASLSLLAWSTHLSANDLIWNEGTRQLTVAEPGLAPWITDGEAELQSSGGTFSTSDERYQVRSEETESKLTLFFDDQQEEVDLRWELEGLAGKRFVARLTVSNVGQEAFRLNSIRPFQGGLVAERHPALDHVLTVGLGKTHEPEPTVIPEAQTTVRAGYALALQSPPLVMGFVEGKRNFPSLQVRLGSDRQTVTASGNCEGVLLNPGAERVSDPVFISHEPQPLVELERYAEITGQRNNAIIWPPRVAWCTWYAGWRRTSIPTLREGMQAGIYETIPEITEMFGDRIKQTLRICDDYITYGDWPETTEELSDGYTELARRIDEGGIIPGVWYPVFWAGSQSQVLQNHPDWFAENNSGDLYKVTGWQPESRGTEFFTIFDASHPEVQEYFEETARNWREKGYRYVTNDFMQYGHQPPQYHDPTMTKAEIMYAGMSAVRRGLGDDVFYRTIGAPLGACMGISNDVRISGDSFGDHPTAYFNTGQFWFFNRRVWLNDPSAIVSENDLDRLPWNRMWMSWIALSGTVMTYGEILPELDPAYQQMYRRVFPPLPVAGRPLDIWENDPFRLWGMHPGEADGTYDLFGVFDLDKEEQDRIKLNLDAISAACRGWQKPEMVAGDYLLWDFWDQKLLRSTGERLELPMPERDGYLFALRPKLNRPQLLGTSGHFSQGVVESRAWQWDPATGSLRAEVKGNGGDPSTFFFHLPEGWTLTSAGLAGETVSPTQHAEQVLAVPVDVEQWQPLELRFAGSAQPAEQRAYIDGPTAVVTELGQTYVEPIDWTRFDSAVELSANDQLLREAVRHFDKDLLTNHRAKFEDMPRRESGYLDLPNRGIHRDVDVREPAFMAAALATSFVTGAYDESVTGVPLSEAKAFAIDLLTSVAGTHNTNDPDGWGDDWQSALWASAGAKAAWLLWDDLDAVDQTNVARMVEHEADRFIGNNPPEANGSLNNTYAEDNSWNATLLDIAPCMMPTHPNAPAWLDRAVAYRLSASAKPSDMDSDEAVHGRAMSVWVDGYNVFEEGYVVNHGVVPHPNYAAATMKQNAQGAICYGLSARDTPISVITNLDDMYGNYMEFDYTAPPYAQPGGMIYQEDGTIFWPYAPGNESNRRFRYDLFAAVDTLARTLGFTNSATDWENLHWSKVRYMQENPDEPNADLSNGGYPRAHNGSIAWMTAWLKAHGAINMTNEPLSAYLYDEGSNNGPPTLEQVELVEEGSLLLFDGAKINQRGEVGTIFYTSAEDLVPVNLIIYNGGDGGVLVPDGEAPPEPGQRGALLDGDLAINTGIANIGGESGALVVEFQKPLVNGPGAEILIAELGGNDSLGIIGKDGSETVFDTAQYDLTSTSVYISLHGGLSSPDLSDLENAGSFPVVRNGLQQEIKFLLVDLTDLGYESNETLTTLSVRTNGGGGADLMLILGIPTWRHDFTSYQQTIADPTLRTAAHDADGDGSDNLQEYAENRDANTPDTPCRQDCSISPGERLVIGFYRQAGKPDLLYRVFFGSSLGGEDWDLGYRSDTEITNIEQATWKTVSDPMGTVATHPQRFGYVKISLIN